MNCTGSNCVAGASPFASDLFPSIVQCFSIILIGYLSARFGLLNSANAKGISTYITTFALPAVFFQAMVTIDFNDINWYFLGAICITKVIMFAGTVIVVLVTTRPMSLSMAGILAIFTSQSNDVALGYPMIVSLLPKDAHYIYLVAPIQLAVLNPIGFILMEVQKHYDRQHQVGALQTAVLTGELGTSDDGVENVVVEQDIERQRRKQNWHCGDSVVWRIFIGVFGNPLVFMTLIGVPVNFILKQKIPEVINKALTVVAQSFAGTALFVLGFNMLNKLGSLNRRAIYLVTILLVAKLVITPFLMYQMVEIFSAKMDNATLQHKLFAFLYGGIPTAPSVFLFASNYHVAIDVVASGLVLGTFISFPWTYISARLVTLAVVKETDYNESIRSTSFNISILSIFSVVWVFIIFILSRRYRRMPHMYTTGYLFSILIACIGCIGNSIIVDDYKNRMNKTLDWKAYVTFFIFFVGVVGTRVWALIMAIVLVFLKMRGLCFVLYFKWLFFAAGLGAPLIMTTILLVLAGNQIRDVDAIFQFGRSQLITALISLVICLFGMIVCMIALFRHLNAGTDDIETSITDSSMNNPPSTMESTNSGNWDDENDNEESRDTTIQADNNNDAIDEALEAWLNSRRCTLEQHNRNPEQRQICQRNLIRYRKSTRSFLQEAGEAGLGSVDKEYQTHEHTIIFILSLLSMFLGILLCTWRLVNEQRSGVYLMLEFIDVIFTFGQGFFAFAFFGLDTDLIIMPFKKKWRKILYGVEEIHLPPEEHLDSEIITSRQNFVRYHLSDCKKALVGKKRSRSKRNYNYSSLPLLCPF